MYVVFCITIRGGGFIQAEFSEIYYNVLIPPLNQFLEVNSVPEWVKGILISGLGQGIYTTLSFIPVITLMFFCLSVLESSGYMIRAGYVMDKVMQWVGLSGKSFMPMVLGFGCNVPAILGARTLENPQQRILTILMTPFMSCGARLAIYALFVSAFFPENGQNIIFALYLIGILTALFTGLGLRGAIITEKKSDSTVVLTPYRWPNLITLLRSAWNRGYGFALKAGMVIVPLCVIIGSLSSLKTASDESWLTVIGRQMTPIFEPMGLKQENWPATVGLLTGILAKEVAVGTLAALYDQESHYGTDAQESVQKNSNQTGLQVSTQNGSQKMMAERFGSKEAAFAYLLFVLLYFPCVSVLATMARELNLSWALFSALWTTGIAYEVAVVFYQSYTFAAHPFSSFIWVMGCLTAAFLGIWAMRRWARQSMDQQMKRRVPTRIVVSSF
jgi:ferrous iron transport protein B